MDARSGAAKVAAAGTGASATVAMGVRETAGAGAGAAAMATRGAVGVAPAPGVPAADPGATVRAAARAGSADTSASPVRRWILLACMMTLIGLAAMRCARAMAAEAAASALSTVALSGLEASALAGSALADCAQAAPVVPSIRPAAPAARTAMRIDTRYLRATTGRVANSPVNVRRIRRRGRSHPAF